MPDHSLDGLWTSASRLYQRLEAWAGERLGNRVARLGWIVPVAAVVVIAIAIVAMTRSRGESTSASYYEVQPSDVTIRITERGELRALDSVTISAQKDYPIVYLAPEGTEVEEGDLVVKMDAGKYESEVQEARAALQIAQANLTKAERELETQQLKLQAGVARFEGEVQIAELEMDELKKKPLPHQLERAKSQLENAKLTYENAEKKRNFMPGLVEKGFVTQSALAEAELDYHTARADLATAQFEYDQVAAGATPQELQRAEITLGQAKGALDKARSAMRSEFESFEAAVDREQATVRRAERLVETAEVKLARTTMLAPRAGIVVYADVGDGSKVQLGMIPYEGQPIVYLPDLSRMVVDTEINEIDIGKVAVGAPVEVTLEAYSDAAFPGKVMEISSLAKTKSSAAGKNSGVKAFDVTVLVEAQDPRLKPGLTVGLDILVEHKEDVLAVPLAAVTERFGEHVVFVESKGSIQERVVQLGHSNSGVVIVKEGLSPGERVLLGRPPS